MKPASFAKIKGGVCAPTGFLAGGIHCGVKSNAKDLDLAILVSTAPAATAATFTTNRVKAAPVRVSMAHLKLAGSRAIVANSGNANACTGPEGVKYARMMAACTAKALGLSRSDVLVCSTGRIGVPLPIARIEKGIAKLAKKLRPNGGRSAARAILTSDTVSKEYALEFKIGKTTVRLGGMAKGAGMIDPNMATMLAFMTTDVAISDHDLQKALGIAVDQSFNRITIDGDMSTNDTVICIANGQSACSKIKFGTEGFEIFQNALNEICLELAKMIVNDGESITKVIELRVCGAATYQDARKAARSIANSILVKCAWHGGDPNWGRLMDALGYSGARMKEESVEIHYNGLSAVQGGVASQTPTALLRRALKQRSICLVVNLNMGTAEYRLFTTDLSPGYVKFNMGE